MPRNYNQYVENQFTQGLITEATGMNFPERAAIEAWNTRFGKKGNVTRRLGFDFENGVLNVAATAATGVVKRFIWKAVAERGRISFLVMQTGSRISFYKPDSNGDLSSGLLPFSINIATYKVGGTGSKDESLEECAFAAGIGKLFIVHPYCDPMYVVYNEDANTITVTQYKLKIRDFKGVEDDHEIDERPTTLSNKHKYNIFNQGWYVEHIWSDGKNYKTPYLLFFSDTGTYPSNADIWWLMKDSEEKFSPTPFADTKGLGNTEAAKGHYIYDAFRIDREEETDIPGLAQENSDGERPTTIAFFAGRVFYGGVRHKDYTSKIFYTQIILRDEHIGSCYQINDPTSEFFNDLLATDGGVLLIPEMAANTALFNTRGSLVVFSTNGIWSISGSGASGTGFSATDFSVSKISSVSLNAESSLVDVEGTPLWWNYDGIWTAAYDDKGGYSVTSPTDQTIRSFYLSEIPMTNKTYAQGSFNPFEKTVQWLYRSTQPVTALDNYAYDRILELNLTTGAFYPMEWDILDQKLSSIFCIPNLETATSEVENVVDTSGVAITDSIGAIVTISSSSDSIITTSSFKYFINNGVTGVAFVEESNPAFLDFSSLYVGGKDYSSYFISGAKVHGEGNKTSNFEYITILANTITNGSCKFQVYWDYANNQASNKWSTKQEIYSSVRPYRDVSRKRLLVRGSGQALQMKFTSVSGKPFDIIGWVSLESADATP